MAAQTIKTNQSKLMEQKTISNYRKMKKIQISAKEEINEQKLVYSSIGAYAKTDFHFRHRMKTNCQEIKQISGADVDL